MDLYLLNPTQGVSFDYSCDRKSDTRLVDPSLGRHPSAFSLSFEAVQYVTIAHEYNNAPNTEHMVAGKTKGQPKKRFLISFDTKKIPRRAIVHSAELYLYLAEFGASDVSDEAAAIPSNSLEIYQVVSTDWVPENTTSVIPWHQDYLGIGSDVPKNRYYKVFSVFIIVPIFSFNR